MAEHEIRALREYSQSLENQNIALNRECRALDEQLATLSSQYEQLSLAHAGCHNVLVQREHDMIKMQDNHRIEQEHLYDQLKQQELKNRMETVANISKTRIQPTPLHLSFGGLNDVLESRLEHLNIGRADVMEEHIQRVVGFRNLLAGTMEELHQYQENKLQQALIEAGETTPHKQLMKDANVQTDPQIDQDIEHLIRILKEQEDKVNWLASQLEERHLQQRDMTRPERADKSELIRIEVHDPEDRLQFSTQLHIIDDDSEEESVDVLALGGPVRIRNIHSNNDFISEVENMEVRNRHAVEYESDASQEPTVKYNVLTRMQKTDTQGGHSLSSLLRQLEIIIQALQTRSTTADAQALLRIGVLLRSKAEELEHVNLTISHYLHNTSQAIPVNLEEGAQRGSRWNPTTDDQWKTSLELLSGSRSKELGHLRQQTSSIHSRFISNKERGSTSFERSQMSISGQLPSLLKKPNLTDLSAKISELKHAHEQRRRKHCNMNRI